MTGARAQSQLTPGHPVLGMGNMAEQWTNLFQFQIILSPSDNVKLPEKLFLTHIPIRAHTECVITCPLRLRTGLDKLVAHLDYLCTDHPMLYFNIQRTEKYSIAMCYKSIANIIRRKSFVV